MARITAGKSHDGDETLEARGVWWYADSDDLKVGGILSYSQQTGGLLRLQGGLCRRDTDPRQGVLLGRTDTRGLVTIADAHLVKSTDVLSGEVINEDWRCYTIFVGEGLGDGQETLFETMRLSTGRLPWWVRKPFPETEHGVNGEVAVTVQVPEALEACLGEDTLRMIRVESSRHSLMEIEVTVQPYLCYRPAGPIPYEAYWEKFVTPTLFFLTLATGEADWLRDIWVTSVEGASATQDGGKSEPTAPIRVLTSRWSSPAREEVGVPRWWEFTLPFEHVEDRFETVWAKWFEVHTRARAALLEFFSVPLSPEVYLEDTFSRVVRALELWHRALVGGVLVPEKEYEAVLVKVRQALTRSEWEIVGMRLRYGNEPTQKRRLDELIEEAGLPLTHLISQYTKFTRRVIDMRNQMTHGAAGVPPIMTDEEMFWAQKALEAVFFAVLLRHLFPNEEVESMIVGSRAWNNLNVPANTGLSGNAVVA